MNGPTTHPTVRYPALTRPRQAERRGFPTLPGPPWCSVTRFSLLLWQLVLLHVSRIKAWTGPFKMKFTTLRVLQPRPTPTASPNRFRDRERRAIALLLLRHLGVILMPLERNHPLEPYRVQVSGFRVRAFCRARDGLDDDTEGADLRCWDLQMRHRCRKTDAREVRFADLSL